MAEARAWQLVLARIEADLLSGRIGIGDHLPPERTLAVELGVGRSSVREAVRVLEAMGLVRTGTGSGPSAGAVVVSRPEGGMSSLMRLQVASRGFPVNDVVRTRVLLESAVARDLAHSARVPAAVEPLLAAMESAGSPTEFLVVDARFHAALAESAGNAIVGAVMAGLRGSIEEYVIAGAASVDDWPSMASRLMHEHRSILDAISSGDADAAERTIVAHITGYYADTDLVAAASRREPLPASSRTDDASIPNDKEG